MPTKNNLCFVQFCHPGREHKPDQSEVPRIEWNPMKSNGKKNGHGRKFLSLRGRYHNGHNIEDLWAWGEWEPESTVLRCLQQPIRAYPRYLWKPYYEQKRNYRGLHNTDPFIFDGFYYTNCKQWKKGRPTYLTRLEKGSVIVFGSKTKHGWVVDTVFVVRDFVDHTKATYQEVLKNRVPDCYEDVVLKSTYVEDCSKKKFRLYQGATVNEPFEGMYSFFPCMRADDDKGFPRPVIKLPAEYFTPTLTQGEKRSNVSLDVLQDLWACVKKQVHAQGLLLGTRAEAPTVQRPEDQTP